jgi:type III pantothenate kinase
MTAQRTDSILALDIGNSQITLGEFRADSTGAPQAPSRRWNVSTHPLSVLGEDADILPKRIREGIGGTDPESYRAMIVASVVPPATDLLRKAWPKLIVIDSGSPFSFEIGTLEPHRTGLDRLVNAQAVLGLIQSGPAAALILDAGTATTLDVLSLGKPRPRFEGGAILPGLAMIRDTLSSRTSLLPRIELSAGDIEPIGPIVPVGKDTESALRSGILLGYASMIDGMIARFRDSLGLSREQAPVFVTGGLSSLLVPLCRELTGHADPDLTLKGVAALYASLCHR